MGKSPLITISDKTNSMQRHQTLTCTHTTRTMQQRLQRQNPCQPTYTLVLHTAHTRSAAISAFGPMTCPDFPLNSEDFLQESVNTEQLCDGFEDNWDTMMDLSPLLEVMDSSAFLLLEDEKDVWVSISSRKVSNWVHEKQSGTVLSLVLYYTKLMSWWCQSLAQSRSFFVVECKLVE